MKTSLILVLLAFVLRAVASDGVWYDGDKVAPDRPFQKAKAGFGVQLQLTKKLSFFTEWYSPETPRFELARTAQVGDKVYSALFFFGAGKNPKGESHITFFGRVVGPNGKPIQEFKDVRAVQGPNRSIGYDLSLSEGYMIAEFSAASEKGVYTFEVTVTDHVKNVSIPLVQKIELK